MKLRAWVVFPLAGLLLVASFFAANILLLRHVQHNLPPAGDSLNTIEPPWWFWPLILGPPLLLIGSYVWQRVRQRRSR